MKLIIRNTCPSGFVQGCEYTVVDTDKDLVNVITARGEALRRLHAEDSLLWQLRYWDWRPICINTFEALESAVPPDAAGLFAEWIEDEDGWVLVGDLTLPDSALVSMDRRTMTVTMDGPDVEVGWAFTLTDDAEVIRSAGISLTTLTSRLGRPGR